MPPATTETDQQGTQIPSPDSPEYRKLVQQVADKVWALWQQEQRRERERRGSEVSKCRP